MIYNTILADDCQKRENVTSVAVVPLQPVVEDSYFVLVILLYIII